MVNQETKVWSTLPFLLFQKIMDNSFFTQKSIDKQEKMTKILPLSLYCPPRRYMELMEDNRNEFLARIGLKKKQLEEALARLRENQKEYYDRLSNDSITDESDHAQREVSLHGTYSMIEKKTRELRKIDHIVKKVLKDEEFGVCEECGDPIPAERLLIVPETNLCIACQRELEKFDQLRGFSGNVKPHFEGGGKSELDDFEDTDEFHYSMMDAELDVFPIPSVEDEGLELQGFDGPE
jgi:DnaK suppressor protein